MSVVSVQAPYCEPGFPGGAAKIDRPSSESGQERGRGPCLLVSRLAGLGRASRTVRGLDGNDGRGEMSDTTDLIEAAKKAKPDDISLLYGVKRLARVCEILLEQHPVMECDYLPQTKVCPEHFGYSPAALLVWCQPCRDRAIRERCDKEARGEK